MSIIQEALKKIEKPGQPKREPAAEPRPEVQQQQRPEPQQEPRQASVAVVAPPPRETASSPRPTLVQVPSRHGKRFLPLLVLAGLMVVVAIAFVALMFFGSLKNDQLPRVHDAAPVTSVLPATPSHQETIYRMVEPDPAVPAATVAPEEAPPPRSVVRAEPPDLALNGIMHLETGPRAIINNAIVSEGDMVNGAIVRSINKKSVILTYNNVEITLNLK